MTIYHFLQLCFKNFGNIDELLLLLQPCYIKLPSAYLPFYPSWDVNQL